MGREVIPGRVGNATGKHRDKQITGWTIGTQRELRGGGGVKLEKQSGASKGRSYVYFKS